MADIFQFRPPSVRKPPFDEENQSALTHSAEILFFTGVRYERPADCIAAAPKPARTKKTGGSKPRCRA